MALNLYQVNVPPYKYVHGVRVITTSDTTPLVKILPGEVRDDTNGVNMIVENTITLSQTNNGANGLDTGTIAENSFYAVYVIADPSGLLPVAGLMSLSMTNPIMPALRGTTYGVKRLVGFASTTSGTSPVKFTPTYVIGDGPTREMYYSQTDTNNRFLNNSAAPTSVTAIDLSKRMPLIPDATNPPVGFFDFEVASTTASDILYLSSVTSASMTSSTLRIKAPVINAGNPMGMLQIPASPDVNLKPNIYAQATVTATMTLTAFILGFRFNI